MASCTSVDASLPLIWNVIDTEQTLVTENYSPQDSKLVQTKNIEKPCMWIHYRLNVQQTVENLALRGNFLSQLIYIGRGVLIKNALQKKNYNACNYSSLHAILCNSYRFWASIHTFNKNVAVYNMIFSQTAWEDRQNICEDIT